MTKPQEFQVEIKAERQIEAVIQQRNEAMDDAARWRAVAVQTLHEKAEAEQEILRLREKIGQVEEAGMVVEPEEGKTDPTG
jgi:hypothetical protein